MIPYIINIILIIITGFSTSWVYKLDYGKSDSKQQEKYKYRIHILIPIVIVISIISIISTCAADRQDKNALNNANHRIDSLTTVNAKISISNSNKIDSSLVRLNDIVNKSKDALVDLKALSTTLKNVQSISDKLQYPLPIDAKVSFTLDFQLIDTILMNRIDSIAISKFDFQNKHVFGGLIVPLNWFENTIDWSKFSGRIDLHFSKVFEQGLGIGGNYYLTNNPVNDFQNGRKELFDLTKGENIEVSYSHNPRNISLHFENIHIIRRPSPIKYSSNYLGNSIKDLEYSTAVLRIFFPKIATSIKIRNFSFEASGLYFDADSLAQSRNTLFYYHKLETL